MKVCIVSTEYAFEYPLGDFCYPFRLLAQELTKRNHDVTVLCLGPAMDVIHHGVRLRAVSVGHRQSALQTFGQSLQVWEYLSLVRDTLLSELATLSLAQPFDVVEASAQLLGKQLLDLPSGFALRLNDPELPQGASTTERDLNLRLIKIKQSQAVIVADSVIFDRAPAIHENIQPSFGGDPMLEHLSFDIPEAPPPPLLPLNSSKSVFVAQWFKVAEARKQTLEVIAEMAKNTNDFRFIFPCDCTASENNELHQKDVLSARDRLSQEIGSSARLWVVHNLKIADLATCLSGCEAIFVPNKAGIGFEFLGGYYGIPTVESGDHFSAPRVLDSTLSETVRATLAQLVQFRISSYQKSTARPHESARNQFVDDVDNLVLDMDRIAGKFRMRSSLTDKIKNKVRRVLASASGGAK